MRLLHSHVLYRPRAPGTSFARAKAKLRKCGVPLLIKCLTDDKDGWSSPQCNGCGKRVTRCSVAMDTENTWTVDFYHKVVSYGEVKTIEKQQVMSLASNQ